MAAHVKEKKEALGEVLNGDRLVSAPYTLDFLANKDSEVVCKKKLTTEEVAQFRTAVRKDYYFQMYFDDLPIWGFIGKVDREGKSDPSDYKCFLFKHIHFDILYNVDRVIDVNAQMDPHYVVDLKEDKMLMQSSRIQSNGGNSYPFENRMDKFSDFFFTTSFGDPLVFNHKLMCHGAPFNWFPCNNSHAGP